MTWQFLKRVSGCSLSSLGQFTPRESAFLQELTTRGLIGPPLEKLPAQPFAPRRLILLPTADCNLRCRYCFSQGGADTTTMRSDVARAAIRLAVEMIRGRGGRRFTLVFLGGGEPTMALDLMKQSWQYAADTCTKYGMRFTAGMTTNGYWSETTGRWIASHFHRITVSLDGTAHVMALHRPSPGGANIFDIVTRNVRMLLNAGCRVGIRSTVSAESLQELNASLHLFHSLGVRSAHFEPLTPAGRSNESDIRPPHAAEFANAFWEVQRAGRRLGMRVTCSAALKPGSGSRHCLVAHSVICVTPDGALTACHRSAGGGDNIGRQFHYGSYKPEQDSFVIDREALEGILADCSAVPVSCANCIASVHCTGGCYYDNVVGSGSRTQPREDWCRISRELTCRLIEQRLHPQAQHN